MTINNGIIKIDVAEHGAELQSLMMNNYEYLWNANPNFWARHAPILFPIVGRVWNNVISVDNEQYSLSQHGFARDMDFTVIGKGDTSLFLQLVSNETTLQKFPYHFELNVSYHLNKNKVYVTYEVVNTGVDTMFFQIGAHPGFFLPRHGKSADNKFVLFSDDEGLKPIDNVIISSIGEKGCLSLEKKNLRLDAGVVAITPELFNHDALIFEDSQVRRVTIKDADNKDYISVVFDAPVLGLWSPNGKNAPFVCIEPWYGRCDRENFTGDISDKEWINRLDAGKNFVMEFCIVMH